jgi:hypothetical protein
MKKRKQKSSIVRSSFSVPRWMEPLIKERAKSMDITLSQYIRWLVKSELEQAQGGALNSVITEYEP